MIRPAQHGAFILQLAELPYLPDANIGIANNLGRTVLREAFVLNIARGLHALTDRFRRFSDSVTAQLIVIDTRHFDVDVDSIE